MISKSIFILIVFNLFKLGCLDRTMDFDENTAIEFEEDPDSSEHGTVTTSISTNCSCGRANRGVTKIVRGKVTLVNEYPFMAGLVLIEDDVLFCGGTIITEKHILTAAHCLHRFPVSFIGIHVGHHNYYEVKHLGRLLKPERFIMHHKYIRNFIKMKYDIAIVLMKEPIEFDSHVGPVCLPKEIFPIEKKTVKLIGWGRTGYYEGTSKVLLKTYVEIISFEDCIPIHYDQYNRLEIIDRHQLCSYRNRTDACEGDSGGPLLWLDGEINRYIIVGVVSYGEYCAQHPSVNSDVFYFLPWIQQVISNASSQICTKM